MLLPNNYTFKAASKIIADEILNFFIIIFQRKYVDILCELSARLHMKCQALFL